MRNMSKHHTNWQGTSRVDLTLELTSGQQIITHTDIPYIEALSKVLGFQMNGYYSAILTGGYSHYPPHSILRYIYTEAL